MTSRSLQVMRVEGPSVRSYSWSVLDLRAGGVLEPAEAFLTYLSMAGRSPNTVRAYAYDLCDLFEFLRLQDRPWERLTLEQVGHFVSWFGAPDSYSADKPHPDALLEPDSSGSYQHTFGAIMPAWCYGFTWLWPNHLLD